LVLLLSQIRVAFFLVPIIFEESIFNSYFDAFNHRNPAAYEHLILVHKCIFLPIPISKESKRDLLPAPICTFSDRISSFRLIGRISPNPPIGERHKLEKRQSAPSKESSLDYRRPAASQVFSERCRRKEMGEEEELSWLDIYATDPSPLER